MCCHSPRSPHSALPGDNCSVVYLQCIYFGLPRCRARFAPHSPTSLPSHNPWCYLTRRLQTEISKHRKNQSPALSMCPHFPRPRRVFLFRGLLLLFLLLLVYRILPTLASRGLCKYFPWPPDNICADFDSVFPWSSVGSDNYEMSTVLTSRSGV